MIKYLFKKTCFQNPAYPGGFTLAEVMAALVILGFFCSGVLVVIERCMDSAVNSSLQMQAFETARENMENLLVSSSLLEKVEYGTSEKYPDIEWQTSVETFYEPLTDRMWVQAVCSSEYTDTAGQEQTIELTHWLNNITKQQLLEIIKEKLKETDMLADQIIKTVQEAAEYAGVETEQIMAWAENGMRTTKEGYFIESELNFYFEHDGEPSAEAKNLHAQQWAERPGRNEPIEPTDPEIDGPKPPGPIEPGPDEPEPEPDEPPNPCKPWPGMTLPEIMNLMRNCF